MELEQIKEKLKVTIDCLTVKGNLYYEVNGTFGKQPIRFYALAKSIADKMFSEQNTFEKIEDFIIDILSTDIQNSLYWNEGKEELPLRKFNI